MIGLPEMESLAFDVDVWTAACLAAAQGQVDDASLLLVQKACAEEARWDGVYILSVLAGVETSVLIDADDKVFIDWGTAGQVTLQPPIGGRSPFKVWVHTHPRFASYWSVTDKNSLSLGATILEKAIVLGEPGPKFSTNSSYSEMEGPFINDQGPLAQWTEEEPVDWNVWYDNNNIKIEVKA